MRNRLPFVGRCLLLFAATLCLIPTTHALEIYGGVSGVHSTLSGMCDGATGNPNFSGSCDDTSTGFKAFAGLQLIPLTAVELGYTDFGKAQATGTLQGVPASPETSANATYGAFLLRWTFFERLTLWGKAGVDYWRANGSLGQTTINTSQSANGWSYMYGVGLSFRIVGPVGIIGEFERYPNVGKQDTTGEANINGFSVGLVVRF
jgi:opacity protein-like surface antigen